MELCHILHKENGRFNMDDDYVLSIIQRATRQHNGIIGVVGERDKLEGSICLLIDRFWYSRDLHLEELWNFVHPDHRRSQHAKTLIGYAKNCSLSLDLALVIGVMSDERTEAKVRLYERQLGKPAGAFFIFNNHYENKTVGQQGLEHHDDPRTERAAGVHQ